MNLAENRPTNDAPKGSGGTLCRDCHRIVTCDSRSCPHCLGPRLVHHAELFSLSIAHVDCDAFYAAIEKRDRPELANKPVIVGGGTRGVVATACYVARAFGVKSAMPMFKALAACPDAVVIKPDFSKYSEAARLIRSEFDALTPAVQPISIDEAFLDLTGTQRLHEASPAQTLSRLATAIKEKVGITVSIGLSHNKFLAKIASDLDKPRGFAVIGEAETVSFLAAQPVSLIWGVGQVMTSRLSADGFNTIGDLQQADPKTLTSRYGETGLRLSQLAFGKDSRKIVQSEGVKSISSETTFNTDKSSQKELEDALWPLCEKVSARMKAKNLEGRVVTLKLKTASFKSITRRITLETPTALARVIFEVSQKLLNDARTAAPGSYRLIGVGLSNLSTDTGTGQHGLFGDPHEKIAAQEKAIDALREKFGKDAVGTGRNLSKTSK